MKRMESEGRMKREREVEETHTREVYCLLNVILSFYLSLSLSFQTNFTSNNKNEFRNKLLSLLFNVVHHPSHESSSLTELSFFSVSVIAIDSLHSNKGMEMLLIPKVPSTHFPLPHSLCSFNLLLSFFFVPTPTPPPTSKFLHLS